MREKLSKSEKPKVWRSKKLHLTPEEANALIDGASKRGRYPKRDRLLLQLIYRHGLRVSEACELRWSEINLRAGTIYITRKKMGNDSTHTMERDEIQQLRKWQAEHSGDTFVFSTERGGPLSVDAVQYIVREAAAVAGLPENTHPHMLRHAAGYFLTNNGTDMRLVQSFLGHRTAAMTMHYSALSPKRLAAVRVR